MNKNILKICIITPGILASNPRVVKEAAALSGAGYAVHIIYTRHVDYLIETDQAILDEHPRWNVDYLDWASITPKAKGIRILSGLKRKLADFLLKNNLHLPAFVPFLSNRFYFWQLKKAIDCKADLYIAHYPESLIIAAKAARINQALFAYDAEDYHRGENLPEHILKTIQITEDALLPRASYITAASPLIGQAYQKLYPLVSVTALENMFPLKCQPEFQEIMIEVFSFFWFSQTIGEGRGLEEFIAILGQTKRPDVQLTLLGSVQKDYKNQLEVLWQQAGLPPHLLIFINTVPEKEIFTLAARQHFGLCLEIATSVNRDVCITNKLYSYILSGNYLICSKTQAQENFLKEQPDSGLLIDLNDMESSVEKLLHVLNSPANIHLTRLHNYELGKTELNYDVEKVWLLKQVSSL